MVRFSPASRILLLCGLIRSTDTGTAGRFQLESWELDAACDGTCFVGLRVTALVPLTPPAATSYRLSG